MIHESAWLASSGNQPPTQLKADGGPWEIVQAYLPSILADRQAQLYVLLRQCFTQRVAEQRHRPTYRFHLVVH